MPYTAFAIFVRVVCVTVMPATEVPLPAFAIPITPPT